MSEYNKGRRIQVIMTIVVFAFFLACLIVMFIGKKELNFLMYIFLGLAVVAFIASMVINSKFKKSSIDSIDSYVHSYFFILDCFSYSKTKQAMSSAHQTLKQKIVKLLNHTTLTQFYLSIQEIEFLDLSKVIYLLLMMLQ